jgi:hypothetical protein
MGYLVRTPDVAEARDAMLSIWATNLSVRGAPEARLRWFYSDGPHGPGWAFLLHTGDPREAPVGVAGLGIRRLWLGDRPLHAGLFADLAIERAHRSGLPALALVRAVRRHVADQLDLGYGFPNHKAVAIYRRAGYHQLGEMQRYVRVLRSGPYVARRVRPPALACAAAAVADLAIAAYDRARARLVRGFELTWIHAFDPRFDGLWAEGRHLAPIACERTEALLTWRFLRQPGHRYRIATLLDRRTRRLRAYAVVRVDTPVPELSDLYGAGLGELDALLRLLLPALSALGHGSVTLRFLGTPALPALLARHGFRLRPERRMVALALGDRLAGEPAVTDPAAWYLTDLDEDS